MNYSILNNLNQMNTNKNQQKQEDLDEQEFQFIAENHLSSPDDIYFDQVVAELQQIIFDSSFGHIQSHFMKQYCSVFQHAEENKNQYMNIFKLYQRQVEAFVDKSLHSRIDNFDMPKFLSLSQNRSDQIDENILDMLSSFTDFEIFKQLMLDYKSYLLNEENLKGLTVKSNRLS